MFTIHYYYYWARSAWVATVSETLIKPHQPAAKDRTGGPGNQKTSLSAQLVPLKPHLRRQPRLPLLFKPSNLHFNLFNFNINNFNNNTLIDSNCLGFDLYLKNKRRKTFTWYQLILHILILFKCTLMFVIMFMFCLFNEGSGKIGYTNWVTLLK